jgi:hypothetical protein
MRALIAVDRRPLLRSLAGLLLGIGFLTVALRRGFDPVFGDGWGAGGIFVTLLIPCVILLGAGLLSPRSGTEASPWQTVYVVFGLILLPLTLVQLVNWVGTGGDAGNALNIAWIFGLTALVGLYAGIVANVRYALLICALAIIVSWLGLWDQLLSGDLGDHTTTLRWLLVIIAVFLVGLGMLAGDRRSDFITGAALAAVGAGGISLLGIYAANPFAAVPQAEASFFWTLELLLVSLGALMAASVGRARGPAYAGAIGLAIFTAIVGLDLAHLDSPDGTLLGWPLALLVLGALALAASFRGARRGVKTGA